MDTIEKGDSAPDVTQQGEPVVTETGPDVTQTAPDVTQEGEPVVTETAPDVTHEDEPVVTEVDFGMTMLQMMEQRRPPPRDESTMPVPDSEFITNAGNTGVAVSSTTASKDENLSIRLANMKREKDR